MTRSTDRTYPARLRGYFHENHHILNSITARLDAHGSAFDPADRAQRLRIMLAGLQPAILDHLRFWSGLQDELCAASSCGDDDFLDDFRVLADFSIRHGKQLLGLGGQIAPVLAINRSLLQVAPDTRPKAYSTCII